MSRFLLLSEREEEEGTLEEVIASEFKTEEEAKTIKEKIEDTVDLVNSINIHRDFIVNFIEEGKFNSMNEDKRIDGMIELVNDWLFDSLIETEGISMEELEQVNRELFERLVSVQD